MHNRNLFFIKLYIAFFLYKGMLRARAQIPKKDKIHNINLDIFCSSYFSSEFFRNT